MQIGDKHIGDKQSSDEPHGQAQHAHRIRLAQPTFEEDEIQRVVEVLKSGNLVQGAQVEAFEQAVASYLGVEHAVACSSGTSALHLALLALELKPGDEVIIPDYTFPATANMVEAVGAVPVVVDVDPATFNMDSDHVVRRLTPRTRAIMPVHLFGLAADMRPILALAEAARVPVVEDAACALGATWPAEPKGMDREVPRAVGRDSLMACLSFHPRKIITTGEGGMVVTRDDRAARRLRHLRSHGALPVHGRLIFNQIGFNYRMTEMQGALGVTQMTRLDGFIARRRALAAHYASRLASLPVSIPLAPSGFGHVFQSYVVMLPESVNRDEVISRLADEQIEATIGTYALHRQPYYRDRYGLEPASFPGSQRVFDHSLSLPLHPRMTAEDVDRVSSCLAAILEGFRP